MDDEPHLLPPASLEEGERKRKQGLCFRLYSRSENVQRLVCGSGPNESNSPLFCWLSSAPLWRNLRLQSTASTPFIY